MRALCSQVDPDLNNPDFFFDRQKRFLIFGFFVFGLTSLFNYRKLGPFIPIFILGTIFLLVLVLIPGVGVTRNEATRWLNLGFILLQPSEVAKVALILYFAKAYTNKQEKLHHFGQGVMPPLIVLLLVFIINRISTRFGYGRFNHYPLWNYFDVCRDPIPSPILTGRNSISWCNFIDFDRRLPNGATNRISKTFFRSKW